MIRRKSLAGRAVAISLFALLTTSCEKDASVADASPPVSAARAPAESDNTPPFAATGPSPLPEAYSLIKARTGDLDTMIEHRVIRVLTVYGIGRYYVQNAVEKGLVSESSSLFEDFINKRFKRRHVRTHVVVIPMARDQLIPALLAGRGDIVHAGLSITAERQQRVDFSTPSSKPLSEILVTGPAAPSLGSIEELSGQTLYLRASSSYRESVEALNRRLIDEGKAPVHIQAVSELLEDEDLVEMVNAGLLPWAIVDDYKAKWWSSVFDKVKFRDDIVFGFGRQLAWALRKDNPQLKRAVNDFLVRNREGTLIGNILKNRYVRDFDWAANAPSEVDYHRFRQLGDIFRKYGEHYGFEHLMIAAQAYQESRFRQSARSHAGAIGVMQIKASTAGDHNVNINGIRSSVDANIHAGVKYLGFLRDRYFNGDEIDPLNQVLLSLAAYNVGPGRMIRLRNRSEALGYDPNVWFDNVEIVAAREVGQEPVQYVANIYKLYLHLQLIEKGVFPMRQQAKEMIAQAKPVKATSEP